MLLCIPMVSSGQTGCITGVVRNSSTLQPLALANVQIFSSSLGSATGDDGMFTITGVPVGTYQLRASLLGYLPTIVGDVVVAREQRAEFDEGSIGILPTIGINAEF